MATQTIDIFESPDYSAEVQRAAHTLRSGGIVVLPTETVYGAAGVLNQANSAGRLKEFRNGAEEKPFTIHLARGADAQRYLGQTNDFAKRLIRKLWPGPVGLTFNVPGDRRKEVAAQLEMDESDIYDGPTITLRCPDHPFTADVLSEIPGPVALTMAGSPSEPLDKDLAEKVDLIFDAGPTRFTKPSTLLKVGAEDYQIVRSGVYDERIIERLLRTTILFICSGNTCRSAMSEAIARAVLAQKLGVAESQLESKGITVVSAGTFAMPGARATPQAVEALKEIGADLSRHRSRPLSVELIHQADAIFAMQRSHAQSVLALVPSAADKLQLLDPEGDIEDPIGSELQVYEQLTRKLKVLIEKRLEEKAIL